MENLDFQFSNDVHDMDIFDDYSMLHEFLVEKHLNELNKKDKAYSFILENGLYDEFYKFVNQKRNTSH